MMRSIGYKWVQKVVYGVSSIGSTRNSSYLEDYWPYTGGRLRWTPPRNVEGPVRMHQMRTRFITSMSVENDG